MKNSKSFSNSFYQVIRCISTTETLDPVNLSYATYESTIASDSTSPVIVLHGLFGSKSNWNSLCKAIQRKSDPPRKIIAVDARNHGESPHNDYHTYPHMAADIRALYEQIGIKKACLLGHSMGGRAVMLFSLKYVSIYTNRISVFDKIINQLRNTTTIFMKARLITKIFQPELVEKLLVVDISPATISSDISGSSAIFRALESVKIPENLTMSQARISVDNQLSHSIQDQILRSFMLTNLVQKTNGRY